jgi:ABC-type multidrug transport system fused ATPase/permease subunit
VPVLRDLNFELSQDQMVALCGTTGKSTIMNLLLHFYDPIGAASIWTIATCAI